jgi:phage protein D
MVEATGTTVGLPDLRAGRAVIIRGTGEHFDGRYTVISSTHIFNEIGYRTNFTARRVEPKKV